jgi:hypothetical protein
MPPTCIIPTAAVPRQTELDRTKAFCDKGRKKDILSSRLGYSQRATLNFSPKMFHDLLTRLVVPNTYDGVRVYFAANDPDDINTGYYAKGDQKQLNLIFASTALSGSKYEDDPTNYYIISPGGLVNLPDPTDPSTDPEDDIFTHWTQYYLNNSQPALIEDGAAVTGNSSFEETNSLWYTTTLLQRDPKGKMGLLDFVECLMANYSDPTKPGYFDQVIVEYAGFLQNESEPEKFPWYQLTLIFNFHQTDGTHGAGKDNYFSLAFADLDKQEKNYWLLSGTGTDTGTPCPPLVCP